MSREHPQFIAPDGRSLAVVGVYAARTEAYERSLVVSSMELPHWIFPHEGAFALCTRPGDAEAVSEELARFEAERQPAPSVPSAPVRETPSTLSLYIAAWILAGFFLVSAPPWWDEHGAVDSRLILRGEWWRTITALTLHADLGHLGANLAASLVCAAFLLPIFGTGWTWLLILLTGCLGNWLNALGHPDHLSIGASTAVFGALGLLAGAQCTQRLLALRQVRWREFLLPLGAGFGLLGYLGVGDAETDYTAHLFGFLCGLPLGAAAAFFHVRARSPHWLQLSLAWAAPLLLALSWIFAAKTARP